MINEFAILVVTFPFQWGQTLPTAIPATISFGKNNVANSWQ
jgi:hypothetical protein